jgi:hypothetical protein
MEILARKSGAMARRLRPALEVEAEAADAEAAVVVEAAEPVVLAAEPVVMEPARYPLRRVVHKTARHLQLPEREAALAVVLEAAVGRPPLEVWLIGRAMPRILRGFLSWSDDAYSPLMPEPDSRIRLSAKRDSSIRV